MKFNYSVKVGSVPVRAVVPNPARTALTIFNNSLDTAVYYGADSGLNVDEGMVVLPQTGWSFLSGMGDDPTTAFYLISAAGVADVRIAEGFAPRRVERGVEEE